jgi:MFS-type transporter involved in bile tolerance (Atg22 family)
VILTLTRHERPIYFYGTMSVVVGALGALLGLPVLTEYLETGQVPRFPTLFVASFLILLSSLYFMVGLVIDALRKSRHESSRLAYMRHPAVRGTYVTDPARERIDPPTHTASGPFRPVA